MVPVMATSFILHVVCSSSCCAVICICCCRWRSRNAWFSWRGKPGGPRRAEKATRRATFPWLLHSTPLALFSSDSGRWPGCSRYRHAPGPSIENGTWPHKNKYPFAEVLIMESMICTNHNMSLTICQCPRLPVFFVDLIYRSAVRSPATAASTGGGRRQQCLAPRRSLNGLWHQ